MFSFYEKLAELSEYVIIHRSFLVIWLLPLVGLIIYGCLFFNKEEIKALPSTNRENDDIRQDNRPIWAIKTRYEAMLLIMFVIFLMTYIYMILYETEPADLDHAQLTFYSLRGRFFRMPIWPSIGRFFPLGLQEYNFLSLLSPSPFLYYSFSVFQLLTVIGCLLYILRGSTLYLRLATITSILIIPSFVEPFFDLIIPDRNIIFLLSMFLVCLDRFIHLKTRYLFIIIILTVQLCLYYKEPVFLLFSGFSGVRLFIRWLNFPHKKVSDITTFLKQNLVDVSLIFLSFFFLFSYFIKVYLKVDTYYSGEESLSELSTFILYAKNDFLLCIFLMVVFCKVFQWAVRKKSCDLFWDPLAVGACLYALAYFKLALYKDYLMAPVDFIAALYLSRIVFDVISGKQFFKIAVTACLLVIVTYQNLDFSSYEILSQKKLVDGNIELVKFLKNYSEKADKDHPITLFFPHSESSFVIKEFVAYMDYKGLKLDHDKSVESPDSSPFFVIKGPFNFLDGDRCTQYQPFKCYSAFEPEPGDLVTILPLDKVSDDDLRYEKTLFHYQPTFSPLEKGLSIISKTQEISKSWYNSYVFLN